jgi:hypothetical protein
MIWPFRKRVEEGEQTNALEKAEEKDAAATEKLEEVKNKLADDRAKAKDIAKAVASAKRIQHKVDQFTEEISESFGRLNHG